MSQEVADPSPTAGQVAEDRERQQLLMSALQLLEEAHRSVITLRDIQGYSYEEIGQVLGCQVGTVKSRLSRARLQLRALLDGKL